MRAAEAADKNLSEAMPSDLTRIYGYYRFVVNTGARTADRNWLLCCANLATCVRRKPLTKFVRGYASRPYENLRYCRFAVNTGSENRR